MSIMVNEYVREEMRQDLTARLATRTDDTATEQPTARPTHGLTIAALAILNVLLVAAIGVNVTAAPVFAWIMTAALVVSSLWSAAKLDVIRTEMKVSE